MSFLFSVFQGPKQEEEEEETKEEEEEEEPKQDLTERIESIENMIQKHEAKNRAVDQRLKYMDVS